MYSFVHTKTCKGSGKTNGMHKTQTKLCTQHQNSQNLFLCEMIGCSSGVGYFFLGGRVETKQGLVGWALWSIRFGQRLEIEGNCQTQLLLTKLPSYIQTMSLALDPQKGVEHKAAVWSTFGQGEVEKKRGAPGSLLKSWIIAWTWNNGCKPGKATMHCKISSDKESFPVQVQPSQVHPDRNSAWDRGEANRSNQGTKTTFRALLSHANVYTFRSSEDNRKPTVILEPGRVDDGRHWPGVQGPIPWCFNQSCKKGDNKTSNFYVQDGNKLTYWQ